MDRNKLEKIYNDQYNSADKKCGREIAEIRKYWDGYKQGCDDLFAYARQEMLLTQGAKTDNENH